MPREKLPSPLRNFTTFGVSGRQMYEDIGTLRVIETLCKRL